MNTDTIHNHSDGRDYFYRLEFVGERHLGSLLKVQQAVMAGLRDREIFAPSNPEELARDLGGEGFTVGMFLDREMFGYMSLHWIHWDMERNDELKLDQLLLLSREEMLRTVRFRHIALHPHFHGGNSMMKKMGAMLLDKASSLRNPPRYLVSLHSSRNYPSLKYPFAIGMLAIKIIKNRLGMSRLLCFRDLECLSSISPDDTLLIPGEDEAGLLQSLVRGYYGYGLHRRNGETLIRFGKCERPLICRP